MTVERALIVLAVILVAVIVARLQNRGAAVRRRRRTFTDLAPGVIVFASRSCDQCEAIESMVTDIVGPGGYEIFWWDEAPGVFDSNDIDRVPAIARVEDDGAGWVAVGVPSALRLRRWIGNA